MVYVMIISLAIISLQVGIMCLGLQNNHAINWSKVTKHERKYSYPAYVEVANSQCDLTEDMCDVSCCSDVDCSEEQKSSFECLGGLVDGEQTESLTDWKCGDLYLDSGHFWSPLLCLVLINTPYLGEYYKTQKKIESLSKLSVALNVNKDKNPHTEIEDTISNGTNYYKFGTPVRTKFMTDNNVLDSLDYLKQPRQLHGSAWCSDSSPVRFLQNTDSSCLRKVTMEECKRGASSPLSAFNYMTVDTSNISEDTSDLPFVALDVLSLNSTDTSAQYLCFNNGSDYLRFSNSIFKPVLSEKEAQPDNVSFDCAKTPVELMSTFYNEFTETCENVVISVDYYFTWNSSYISQLSVTYVLADIPVTPQSFLRSTSNLYEIMTCRHHCEAKSSPKFYVNQHFSTMFMSVGRKKMVNGSNEVDHLERSGNPGYNVGRPLLAWAVNSENDSDVQLQVAKLGVWGMAREGCDDITRVTFGYDVIASCSVELEAEEIPDCNSLRARVQELQSSLTAAQYVAAHGANPHEHNLTADAATLVPILRSDWTMANISKGSDVPVNSSLDLDLVKVSNETTSQSTTDRNSTGQEATGDNTRASEPLANGCSSVPLVQALDVLYTTSHHHGQQLHRVVGVKSSLRRRNWFPKLNGSDVATRQRILLTSSVTFVRVPVRDEQPKSRVWQSMLYPDQSETAWINLFRVMDALTIGEEVRQVTASALYLLLLAGTLMFLFWRPL